MALNFPVLRDVFPSYWHQIEKAAARGDLVSLNHRTAALLASLFDILFALNRRTHPGEKRLLDLVERDCPLRPPHLRAQVTALLRAAAANDGAPDAVHALVDAVEALVRAAG